jgi:acid phosphatase type 7
MSEGTVNVREMMLSLLLGSFFVIWVPTSFALDTRGPYLVDLRSDRAVIMFHTDEDTETVMECNAEGGRDQFFKERSRKGKQHIFRLRGLLPGSRYLYRIISQAEDEGMSGPRTGWLIFTTPGANPEKLSFIVYGDSRDSSPVPWRHRQITSHFLKHAPDFVVSTGDLLVGGSAASSSVFSRDWTENFFRPLHGVFETRPYHLAVGNHDQDSSEALRVLQSAFPNSEHSFHYSFRQGDTHFIILHAANQMKEFQSQKRWFVEELAKASEANWRVVFLHVSPFTNGKYRDSSWTLEGRNDFLKTCVENRVDLVVSGHDHSYQRFFPLKATDSDKHAVLFVVTALAGTNPYEAVADDYTAKVVNRTDHFCVVDVNPHELTLTAYDNQNRPFDQVVVIRAAATTGKVWRPLSRPNSSEK